MNKLSIHPPAKKSIEEFILEAEYKKKDQSKNANNKSVVLPWENDLIRDDVQKVFTVKLSEVYLLKIKYISEQTNKSQQRIIREIICREIDKLL
jgi:hypothetical protein